MLHLIEGRRYENKVVSFSACVSHDAFTMIFIVWSALIWFFFFQEFVSFCEAMELIPEEELKSFKQGGSNNFADKRAGKVGASSTIENLLL